MRGVTRALVLAGGGVTGIAWELGALLGLRDEGLDLLDVDLTVGTSAGSAAGAELHSGVDLEELYERQLDPEHHEIAAELDLDLLMDLFGDLATATRPFAPEVLQRVGAKALAAKTVTEPERRKVIEHRLPSHAWPAAALQVTAIDAVSGDFVVFDAGSGVDLVDAVAASCAVPGIWPPVTIGDRRYLDGGIRSIINGDLAAGHDQLVILAPMSGAALPAFEEEVQELRAGAVVALLTSDDEAAAAMGANALDPAMRRPAAEHGRRQGRAAAAGFLALLG